MRFTKHQIHVLVVLCLVIAILFTGIFLIEPAQSSPADADPSDNTPPVTVPHDKFRAPRIGVILGEPIIWETNFGGSEDDYAENAHGLLNGNIIIFGNTASDDYDFDDDSEARTFALIISDDGKAKSFDFFEGRLLFSRMDVLTDSFLLFCKTATTNMIYSISPTDGTLIKSYDLNLKPGESALDYVYGFDNDGEIINYIILRIDQTTEPKVKLAVKEVGAEFVHIDAGFLPHSYSLEYISAYAHDGGLVVAANSTSKDAGAVILYEYKTHSRLLHPNELTIDGKSNYKALAFMPCDGAFAALIRDSNGFYNIVLIDYNRLNTVDFTVHLNTPSIQSASLFILDEYYYAYTFSSGGIGRLQKFSMDFRTKTEMDPDPFSFFSAITATGKFGSNIFFAGTHPETQILGVVYNSGVYDEIPFATKSDVIKALVPSEGSIIVIGESNSKSKDIGGNFGKTDIWVAKINLE